MAIGDDYTTVVPPVGTPGPTYAVTINAILTYLIECVTSSVPFSALSGGNLDMNNVPLQEAQYVGFTAQGSTPSGSPTNRFEAYNGNIYWVGNSGAVQITNGSQLNASALGAIAGDYGGVNPASVRFVDADLMYKFYDDFTALAWGYLRGRGFSIANGAAGTNYASLEYAGAGNITLTVPATLPAANRSVLVISNTGQIEHNDSGDTITNDIHLGGATKIVHGDRVLHFAPVNGSAGAGLTIVPYTEGGIAITAAGGASATDISVTGLQQGWRVKSIVCRLTKTDVTTTTIDFRRLVPSTGVDTSLASNTTAVNGRQSLTLTLGAPETIAADRSYRLRLSNSGNTIHIFLVFEITYDVV